MVDCANDRPERVQCRKLALAAVALGLVNGYAGPIAATVAEHGFQSALWRGFDVSAIEAVAIYTLFARLSAAPAGPGRPLEWALPALVVAVAAVPHHMAAWGGLFLYGVWLVFAARVPGERAAALILVALAALRLWAPILTRLLGPELSLMDASLVAPMIALFDPAATRSGTVITTGSGHSIAVVAGCTSLRGAMAAVLAWLSVTLLVRPRVTPADLPTGAAVVAVAIFLNALRMALMAVDTESYWYFHQGPGEALVNGMAVVLVLGISVLGVRRAL